MNRRCLLAAAVALGCLAFAIPPLVGQNALSPIFPVSTAIGDERQLTLHFDQSLIDKGRINLTQLITQGKFLFDTPFTAADGAGRPNQNGTFPAASRTSRTGIDAFNRISGPDSDSCAGCHDKPRSGGGGDNVANVFVLGQRFSFFDDPTQADENGTPAPGTLSAAADERNTLGMWGSGAIEMLAREMTTDLLVQQAAAVKQAQTTGQRVTLPLTTHNVSFGSITGNPDGSVDTSGVQGVDTDLIIKPFSWKGVVISVRQFTNNAFPQHHGLQPVERFGLNTDPDGDGFTNELSVGDITAATLYQASLAVPGRVIPRNRTIAGAIASGEVIFNRIGCGGCHISNMQLKSVYYTEPNPFNPPANLRLSDVPKPFRFDLTREGQLPRPDRMALGGVLIHPFTDLKRHNMGNDPLMANEKVVQNGVPTDVWLTKKLWGFYSEPHFLHNGCATTLSQAILAHGGEAQGARDQFASISDEERRCVIEFLKSLRVLPEGTRSLVVDEFGLPTRLPNPE
jgi:hypothetical protein